MWYPKTLKYQTITRKFLQECHCFSRCIGWGKILLEITDLFCRSQQGNKLLDYVQVDFTTLNSNLSRYSQGFLFDRYGNTFVRLHIPVKLKPRLVPQECVIKGDCIVTEFSQDSFASFNFLKTVGGLQLLKTADMDGIEIQQFSCSVSKSENFICLQSHFK